MVPPAESKTHRIAVLKQDNGELAEDVVHRTVVATAERVVDSQPAPEVPERAHPAAPVPGTLPRPSDGT